MSQNTRILVGDKLAPKGLDYLNSFKDVEVEVKTGLSEEELAEIIGDYDGLVIRSGVQVTAKVLENRGKLKAIARAGVGVDNIDLDAATKAGVLVMNSAEASTVTTAEHAFTLMMALARNIGPAYKTMTEGGWDRGKFVGTQLHGKTLGIVGFGRIGQTVAERALAFGMKVVAGRIGQTVAERALAFGMKVVAFDPVFNADTALDGQVKIHKNFEKMLPELDVISFHVPLNEHTRGMLGEKTFPLCKEGLLIVNASRGGVVDIPALLKALDDGKVGGAAIDVYEEEPPAEDDPLRNHPKVLVTPHLGASTAEAQEAVSTEACAQILEYLRGEGLRGAVNLGGVRLDLDPTQQRYVDLAERMAHVVAPTCDAGIGDVQVTLEGESLGGAANAIERTAVIELLKAHLDIPVNMVNVKMVAEQRGIHSRTTMIDEPRTHPLVTLDIQTGEKTRHIVGTVYADGQPRVLEIDGYHMDMVPEGPMLIINNEDKPGMVGLIGKLIGDAGLNIADMTLSRRGKMALTVLKLDSVPDKATLKTLAEQPGLMKFNAIHLPELNEAAAEG